MRSGFFLLLLATLAASAQAEDRVVIELFDADTGSPVAGATVRLSSTTHERVALSDSAGRVSFTDEFTGQLSGTWRLRVTALGYEPHDRQLIPLPTGGHQVALQARPLLMDEMVVRGVRDAGHLRTPVFVESLSPAQITAPGADVAQLLQSATGIRIRRYGGLGSSSTVSIRGSTSEQVQVYLDGIPLNQASGGGVDLGSLPVAGIESVDVYRGAVPARFGGNSLGGVLHLRTRALGGKPRWRLQSTTGSFGTRQLSLSASAPWQSFDWMMLIDGSHSDNDFRFFDDNGTEYNKADDGWTRRRNSDFSSLRTVTKAGRALGAHRLQVHDLHDMSHKGLPGIGNFQSLQTRYDMWRNLAEALLYGPVGRAGGYRLRAYHSLERGTFKDFEGEVGAARDHDRTTTRGIGMRGEVTRHAGGGRLITLFADARQERFEGRDLLRDDAPIPEARRRAGSAGGELEAPLTHRLTLHAGGQWEGYDDRFFDDGNFVPAAPLSPANDRLRLWGGRLGITLDMGAGWFLKGHSGHYARAPSFFELFGDRGAIVGNTDLTAESGRNRDMGLHFRGAGAVTLIELVGYDNRVDDLIRFVQNSQFVSRAHNIGRASLRGIESRAEMRLEPILRHHLSVRVGYVHQRAENRSPFTFERGNDLPNAPRHHWQLRTGLDAGRWGVNWDLRQESRHFLDRANLRPVAARAIQGAGCHLRWGTRIRLAFEIRNLTGNGVADLWGYPLPGRAYSLSLSLENPTHHFPSRGT
jgi:outer membrane cobalamin receptor